MFHSAPNVDLGHFLLLKMVSLRWILDGHQSLIAQIQFNSFCCFSFIWIHLDGSWSNNQYFARVLSERPSNLPSDVFNIEWMWRFYGNQSIGLSWQRIYIGHGNATKSIQWKQYMCKMQPIACSFNSNRTNATMKEVDIQTRCNRKSALRRKWDANHIVSTVISIFDAMRLQNRLNHIIQLNIFLKQIIIFILYTPILQLLYHCLYFSYFVDFWN